MAAARYELEAKEVKEMVETIAIARAIPLFNIFREIETNSDPLAWNRLVARLDDSMCQADKDAIKTHLEFRKINPLPGNSRSLELLAYLADKMKLKDDSEKYLSDAAILCDASMLKAKTPLTYIRCMRNRWSQGYLINLELYDEYKASIDELLKIKLNPHEEFFLAHWITTFVNNSLNAKIMKKDDGSIYIAHTDRLYESASNSGHSYTLPLTETAYGLTNHHKLKSKLPFIHHIRLVVQLGGSNRLLERLAGVFQNRTLTDTLKMFVKSHLNTKDLLFSQTIERLLSQGIDNPQLAEKILHCHYRMRNKELLLPTGITIVSLYQDLYRRHPKNITVLYYLVLAEVLGEQRNIIEISCLQLKAELNKQITQHPKEFVRFIHEAPLRACEWLSLNLEWETKDALMDYLSRIADMRKREMRTSLTLFSSQPTQLIEDYIRPADITFQDQLRELIANKLDEVKGIKP